jgi:hypothetical protein
VSLDNDAWVGARWLETLRRPLDHDPGCQQVGRTGTHQHLSEDGTGCNGGPVEYIDGSCFMTRTATAAAMGVCDPLYPFAYCDDSDYSLRLRARGYTIATVEVPVWHPHEHEKLNHGHTGKHDMQAIEADARLRLRRRWSDYLRRRAFDPTIGLIRRGAFGDVLLCTPLVGLLRDLWPQATIYFATDVPDALSYDRLIDHVIGPDEFPRHVFAYTFVLDGAYESDLATNYARRIVEASWLFHPSVTPPLRVAYGKDDAERAESLVGGTRPREPPVRPPLAIFAVTPSTWAGKNPLAGSAFWRPAVDHLRHDGWVTVEVGRGAPQLDNVHHQLVNGTTPSLLYAILDRAQLFVGVDAGPFHASQALGVPAAVLFGCTDPARIATRPELVCPIQVPGLDCLGCHHRQPAGTTSFRGCARGDLACMAPAPEMLLAAVDRARAMVRR